MLYRYQLPNGKVWVFRLRVDGDAVTVTVNIDGEDFSRTYHCPGENFEPKSIVERFLKEPYSEIPGRGPDRPT